MAASKEDISEWFDNAKAEGCTHMLVLCDTFDWDDYPVGVYSAKDAVKTAENAEKQDMTKVMEIYDLSLDKDEQLDTARVWNV